MHNASLVIFHLQVKRVMNGVFHSLRGEFDPSESYSGQAVLEVIVTTIKVSSIAIKCQSSLSVADWIVRQG